MLRQRDTGASYGGPGSSGPRFCRRCRYCVIPAGVRSASWWSRCPECGRTFHGAQPRTTRARPRARWGRLAALGIPLCLLVGAIVLYSLSLEPRRVAKSWTLWRFLGDEYGYEEGLWVWRSREFGRRTYARDGLTFEFDIHNGVANWVRCTRETDGAPVFFVERWLDKPGEWRWGLEVDSPGEAWPTAQQPHVLRAFTLTRSTLFGTYTRWRTTRWSHGCGLSGHVSEERPDPGAGPFSIEGTEGDIYWALFEAYDLETSDTNLVAPRFDGTRPPGVSSKMWWGPGLPTPRTSIDHVARFVW